MRSVRHLRIVLLVAGAALSGATVSAQTNLPVQPAAPNAAVRPAEPSAPTVLPNAPEPPGEQATNVPRPGTPVPGAKAMSDWPCVQRKIVSLTSSQIWDGPAVDELSGWDQDPEIQRLIPILASRRIPTAEAAAEIKKYAESLPGAERDQRLMLLFAGLLSEVNRNRTTVVNGIETFQRRQRLRATELEREGVEIAALQGKQVSAEELKKATELYDWNARIFQERQRNIPLACEIPVFIEQRIYELGRELRTHMKS